MSPLLELVATQTELRSGFCPPVNDVLAYLRRLKPMTTPQTQSTNTPLPAPTHVAATAPQLASTPNLKVGAAPAPLPSPSARSVSNRTIAYTLLGKEHLAATAADALVTILQTLAARDPSKLEMLADAVRTRNNVARSPSEIHPTRPDLTRCEQIAPGWYIGLTISNREKMTIIRAAAEAYGLAMPNDLQIELPNA